MLTVTEKRFVRGWQDQRKGGRWLYFVLYSMIGTFLFTILLSIVLLIFFGIFYESPVYWILPVSSFIISVVFTMISWHTNEKKFKKLVRREIQAGKSEEG